MIVDILPALASSDIPGLDSHLFIVGFLSDVLEVIQLSSDTVRVSTFKL